MTIDELRHAIDDAMLFETRDGRTPELSFNLSGLNVLLMVVGKAVAQARDEADARYAELDRREARHVSE